MSPVNLVITSKQNNIIKYVRGLRDKRTREKEKLFVIEGAKFVYEAVAKEIYPEKIIISDHGEQLPAVKEVIAQAGGRSEIVRVNDAVMKHVCETETPQGILALVKMPEILLADIRVNSSSLFVIIEGVQDPGNVGTIIRTADAFEVDAVILTGGSADLYNAKTLRSTMGSVFHIPVIRDVEIIQLTAWLKENRVFTAVTSLAETALPLTKTKYKMPLAVVFGSEARGVSPGLSRLADTKLKIPMSGSAQSLNVAVAAGIVLYEAFRRRCSDPKSNL